VRRIEREMLHAAEIQGAFDDLTREVGPVLPVFSDPSGDFNDAVVETLRRLAVALTTSRGINDLPVAAPLRLHRIPVGRHTPLAVLRAQLLSSLVSACRKTREKCRKVPLKEATISRKNKLWGGSPCPDWLKGQGGRR